MSDLEYLENRFHHSRLFAVVSIQRTRAAFPSQNTALTSPTRRPNSRLIARGTLRLKIQTSILGVDDGEIRRIDDIRPDFQLDRVVASRRSAVAEAVVKRAAVVVAAPGVGAVVGSVGY
jgi:hypothetical protein